VSDITTSEMKNRVDTFTAPVVSFRVTLSQSYRVLPATWHKWTHPT